MKKILAIVLMLGLTACAQQSPTEYATMNGQRMALDAQMTPGFMDAEFILKVNGQTAIKQRSQPFGGTSQSFTGSYQGKQITARVTQVNKFFTTYMMVDVFYDGELVDTLTI